MPLDPIVKALLDATAAMNLLAYTDMTPEEAREQSRAMRQLGEPEDVYRVVDRVIPGPDGDIPVRVYAVESKEPLPALVYYHGGGWVIGDKANRITDKVNLFTRAGYVFVSINYRLSPAYVHPAHIDDVAAMRLQEAGDLDRVLGLDAGRPDPQPGLGSLTLCAAAAMGFGALNEVVEFIATLLVPETNVGGYINTGWDLVSNLCGTILAALAIRVTRRPT